MSLSKNNYEYYAGTFLRPIGLVSAAAMVTSWASLWLPHVPDPTLGDTLVVVVATVLVLVAASSRKNFQQFRLAAVSLIGAGAAVALSTPSDATSSLVAYLAIELVACGATQLDIRWWGGVVVAIWALWLIEWARYETVEGIFGWLTTSIPLAVATALSAYLSHRLHHRATVAVGAARTALKQASVDPLTGLFNRRGLRAHAKSTVLGAIFVDINGLKHINDTFGHEAGDEAIVAVAKALKETTRPTDILCRWGGDEFVVLCPSGAVLSADILADRANVWLLRHANTDFPVGVSAGQATSAVGVSMAELIEAADEQMYARRAEERGS